MTPSMVWPRRSAALYTKTGIASGVFLGDAQDLVDRRQPLARAAPPVHPQRDHPGRDGVLPDVTRRRSTQHQAARILRDGEQLVDTHAPAVAGAATFFAALAAEELGVVRCDDAEGIEVGRAHLVGRAAGAADAAHEPLGEHGVENTRWPVSEAWIAISAVSRSRISPTRITSGSCRTMCRRPVAKDRPIFGFTAIWLTPLSWYSTGSSTVMILRSGELILSSAP